MKENDVVLETISKIAIFIILTFGFYIFLAGHDNPGGGFIGGLVFSSAFILMFLAFDVETVVQSLPIDFRAVTIIGCLVSMSTAIIPMFFGHPMLTHEDGYITFPLLGEIHLSSVTLFELGILLTVVGSIVTIMLAISGDNS
ncbi:cation:proton antiporter [Mammaliicoccus lentus]|jgi:multicomponent Na+:H+ antiporter subunit B|uniref:Monovalent cation/H+ antiporter subunit B n=1 Tax=Mammaliicoccus lentus TaxID=42858 RepID=A0AAX3W2Z0_MAMLE|nr:MULTISPECIES: monovalent cation/H+ antiporter subunit B [Mammaliicoccus]HBV02784.1 Na(+)/H(+) antiporter subunit B [Staphylococcus sp.]MBF0749630.1 monovalent cation/H+ antiporter subunit B [Mammaliicoccus lentus]MBF0795360.1 monovalent cation/H+ antiporter subunit B [Mammaliicoccus lentus]MBW0763375.1 monovalent cation/H+ antiporter subunit B [Mammaliicoccus lentus]MBW0771372.1 monovalent cation/H+ antiporter subunit B [Mammaliicoccus lentus]